MLYNEKKKKSGFILVSLFSFCSFFHKGRAAYSCDLVWEGDGMCFRILHEMIRAAVCVCVDVILVAPVSCLCIIHRRVHIYLTVDASPDLCLRIL